MHSDFMRSTLIWGCFAFCGGLAAAADGTEPLPPPEARKKVGETITVQMTVQAAKDRLEKRGEIYLDAEADFRDEKNFAVVITRTGATRLKEAGIDDPAEHFRDKTIRVTGEVKLVQDVPRIEIDAADQIRIVDPALEARTTGGLSEKPRTLLEISRDSPETRLFSACPVRIGSAVPPRLAIAGFSQSGQEDVAELAVYEIGEGTAVLRWRHLRDDAAKSSIRTLRAADLNGDGQEELIALGRIGDEEVDSRGELQVFRWGDEQWRSVAVSRWQTGQYTHGYGMDVADLNGDGTSEIVTGGFFSKDSREQAEIRVWKWNNDGLTLLSSTDWGSDSGDTRINSVCIGDVTGDGRLEIVTAGRTGQVRGRNRSTEKEAEQVIVWNLEQARLVRRAAFESAPASRSRFREAKLANLDSRPGLEILAAGRQDLPGSSGRGTGSGGGRGDGSGGGRRGSSDNTASRPLLTVFQMRNDGLILVSEADFGNARGEVRDVVSVRDAADAIGIVTITSDDLPPERKARLDVWQPDNLSLRAIEHVTVALGEETRARQLVAWGQPDDRRVISVGFVRRGDQVLGQILDWGTLKLPRATTTFK